MRDTNTLELDSNKLTIEEINDVISSLVKLMFIDKLNTKNPFPKELFDKIQRAFDERWELIPGQTDETQFDTNPVVYTDSKYYIYWEEFTLEEIEELCKVYWNEDSIEWVKQMLQSKNAERDRVEANRWILLLSRYEYHGEVFEFDEVSWCYVNKDWNVLTIKWYEVKKVFKRWSDIMVHIDNPKLLNIPIMINSQWVERYVLSPMRVVDWAKGSLDRLLSLDSDEELRAIQQQGILKELGRAWDQNEFKY